MTMPGRAVWMFTFALLAARSISILEIPAWYRRRLMNVRTRMSSWRRPAYSLPAYQRESQLSMTPRRKPFGCTFCPIAIPYEARRRRARRRTAGGLHFGLARARVLVERSRRRELPELVADHVLAHEHRNELAAVVVGERVADHVGNHRRAARPGLRDLALAGRIHRMHLLQEVLVDEGTFFDRSRHVCSPRLLLAPHDDEAVRPLVVPRLVAFGRHAPGRLRMVALRAPLAAAVRMIDGIHRDAANARATSEPARPSRLADRDVLVLEVADLADGGAALDADEALLARRQLHERVLAFLCHQLRRAAGAPHHLPALAGAELDVVDHRAEGDRTQRQAVTRADVRLGSRHHAIA